MVTESATESRKVDRRTAHALWDSTIMPNTLWKKKESEDEDSDDETSSGQDVMKFRLLTKRGNKQQVWSTETYGMLSSPNLLTTGEKYRYTIRHSIGVANPLCPVTE